MKKLLKSKRFIKGTAIALGLGLSLLITHTVVTTVVDTLTYDTFVDERKSEQLDAYAEDLESTFHQAEVWGDSEIQDVIHKMSHQKVESTEKWGSILMTSKRVEILSSIVDQKQFDLKHYDVYREILDEWEIHNFQNVDKHHNMIWELQGGTVGRATGVMSAERERKYIEAVHGKQ